MTEIIQPYDNLSQTGQEDLQATDGNHTDLPVQKISYFFTKGISYLQDTEHHAGQIFTMEEASNTKCCASCQQRSYCVTPYQESKKLDLYEI